MEEERILNLTKQIYKTTLLFPKKEPLRYKTRELADNVLENFIRKEKEKEKKRKKDLLLIIDRDLEVLNKFFEIFLEQNWVSPEIILEIKKEYDKIKGKIKQEIDGQEREERENLNRIDKQVEKEKICENDFSFQKQKLLDSRKLRILNFLKEKGSAQVWEVNKIFPNVSKRTLRRDFHYLLNQGLIERIGQSNETFYRLKK